MLKKEFKRKDVERVRNLVKGNVNDSAELQVGYTAKKENHKEGDIWEEGGKKWTIKDGLKQTYTKLDKARKEATLPLFCPSCGSLMKRSIDTKMYNIHKKCFNCVTKMEHKLRIKGEYEVSERGEIERWKGGLDKKQLSKDIKESVSIAKENIEKYRNNDKT
jgi:hypothetical protein